MYASESRLTSAGAFTATDGSLPSAMTSEPLIMMGAMLLPIASQAASASSPVRVRQIEGGSVFQNVPLVVRVSFGILKRSNTGAESRLVTASTSWVVWAHKSMILLSNAPDPRVKFFSTLTVLPLRSRTKRHSETSRKPRSKLSRTRNCPKIPCEHCRYHRRAKETSLHQRLRRPIAFPTKGNRCLESFSNAQSSIDGLSAPFPASSTRYQDRSLSLRLANELKAASGGSGERRRNFTSAQMNPIGKTTSDKSVRS